MPLKFKAPKFVKCDGTRDPCTHLRMFCRKMAPYGDNHPLPCQIFPDSLTGPAAIWYMRLEKTSSWREMANAFLEYYQFNTEIVLDHIVLQSTEKKGGESFHEYAQRWRELATQVLPPMMENEMIKWFIDNLKPPYYVKMISPQVTHFTSLIPIGECIDGYQEQENSQSRCSKFYDRITCEEGNLTQREGSRYSYDRQST